ncbi:hypothetical protein ACGF5M_03120 [Gemmatimonadota bacterium]
MLTWKVWTPLVVFFVLAMIFYAALPASHLGDAFLPNIATEVLGIILTLVIVQSFLDGRERALRKSKTSAVRARLPHLSESLQGLARDLLVGSNRREDIPSSFDHFSDLARQELVDGIGHARLAKGTRWSAWFSERAKEIRGQLDRLIDLYGDALAPELVVAMEELLSDPILMALAIESLNEVLENFGFGPPIDEIRRFYKRVVEFLEIAGRESVRDPAQPVLTTGLLMDGFFEPRAGEFREEAQGNGSSSGEETS